MRLRTLPILLFVLLAACTTTDRAAESRSMQRADTAFLQGSYSEAARLYEAALQEFDSPGQRPRLHLRIARCRMGEDRWEDARQNLLEALSADPDPDLHLEILFARSLVLNALGDYRSALSDLLTLEGASASNRGRAVSEDEFRYRLGLARIRTGDWKGGKAELARVDRTGPRADEARIRMELDAFAVQISRSREEAVAAQGVSEASRKKVEARLTSGPPFAVLVGKFSTPQEAQNEATRLRALGFDGAFVLP